jgi:hypothetical protein
MDGDRIAAAARAGKRRLAGMTGRLEAPQARARRRGDPDQQLEVPKMWARVAKTLPPPIPAIEPRPSSVITRRSPLRGGKVQSFSELRAATSLARLWNNQGKPSAGTGLHWFTEGLDTPVLQEAKALLERLTA